MLKINSTKYRFYECLYNQFISMKGQIQQQALEVIMKDDSVRKQGRYGADLPSSTLQKKKAKFQQFEEYQLNFVDELQGIGIETVIAEENTSQEDLTSHEQNNNNLADSQAYSYKMATELDHDHILDYSNLNIQYNKQNQQNQLSHKDHINKLKLDLKILQNEFQGPKYMLNKIREGLFKISEELNKQFAKISSEVHIKISVILSDLKEQIKFLKRKDAQHLETIANLAHKLDEKQNYIKKLEIQRESLYNKKNSENQKYKTLSQMTQITESHSQLHELRTKVNTLQKEKAQLEQQIKVTQYKNIYSSEKMLVNSLTSYELHKMDAKNQYMQNLEKFQKEFEEICGELENMKVREMQNQRKMHEWRVELAQQEEEINEIVQALEARRNQIQQKEEELERRDEQLYFKQQELYHKAYTQERQYHFHMQERPQYFYNPDHVRVISISDQPFPKLSKHSSLQNSTHFNYSSNQRSPTKIKSSKCLGSLSRKIQYTTSPRISYPAKDPNRPLSQASKGNFLVQRKPSKKQKSSLSGRIEQIQECLQRELIALGENC